MNESRDTRTRVQILFSHAPLDTIRDALNSDAMERNVSVNEAAGGILSDYYGVTWNPTNAEFRAEGQLKKLWVPKELREKLRGDAELRNGTITGVAFDVLARHYGLDPVSPRRRSRVKKAA